VNMKMGSFYATQNKFIIFLGTTLIKTLCECILSYENFVHLMDKENTYVSSNDEITCVFYDQL